MDDLDIIGWVLYGLIFAGLYWLARPVRAPRGLERLNYRR